MIIAILCAIGFVGMAYSVLKPAYEKLTDELDIPFLVNFIVANVMTVIILVFGRDLPALITVGLTMLASVIFWKFGRKEHSPSEF